MTATHYATSSVRHATGVVSSVVPLQTTDDPLLVTLFLAGFGLVALFGGWHRYRTSRIVANTPTESVRSMAAGRTELEGTARPVDEPFDQPFDDGEAVLASYEIEEYHHDDDGGDWHTLDSGELVAPFLLDDGTGRALVDVDRTVSLQISDEHRTRIRVDDDEQEPEVVKRFLREDSDVDVSDTGWFSGEDRRYTQEVLPPGSDAYVFGDAQPREDAAGTGEERLVLRRDEGTDRFVVSDMREDELTDSMGRDALLGIGLGVLMLTGAFYVGLTNFVLVG